MRSAEKKRRARDRRNKRRDLVHAAGCTEERCAVRRCAFDGLGMINEACADRIRIPRSVLRHWERLLGGAALLDAVAEDGGAS